MAAVRRSAGPLPTALLVAALVVLLQALLVPLFASPAANQAPRELPVLVAGPPPVADRLAAALDAARPGAFEVTTVPDPATADRALRNRQAYAAFVPGPAGLTLHTAPAAGPAVASLLVQGASGLSGGQPVQVVEVVPGDPDDPRGSGFAAGFLPLGMMGLLGGVLLVLLVPGRVARLAGLVGFGLLAGLGGAGVLQGWLGVLGGVYLANAAAIGLFSLAIAAMLAGLGTLLGRAGIGLGAILLFLVGNSLGAVAAAPELLPQPWGAVGRWLPVGAGADLLRSTAFFDGAGAGASIGALAGYVLLGVVLVLVGRRSVP